nr:hypothetical protein [uncultured Methanomethylovorans sp.]
MEDMGKIPSGLVLKKKDNIASEKSVGIGDVKLALDILNILIFIYKNFLFKDGEKEKKEPADNILSVDPSLDKTSQQTVELAASIAAFHLAELGIPLDCNVNFINDRNEVVSSLGDKMPRERINGSGFMGLYKPASQSAYVRLMGLPEMISTIAHETAHNFLTTRSNLGKFMKDLDCIYEIHKDGSDIKMDTIIGNVRQDYAVLFNVSKITHEGFASWVGHYVLRRFVDTLKQQTFENQSIDTMKLNFLIEAYEHLSKDLDKRASEYYYGRLQYCNIEEFFGPSVVPIAAVYCMDVSYDVNELYNILELNQIFINQDAETMCKNLDALRFSPDMRLAAVSKILPGVVHSHDDISKMDEPTYFVNAIRRFFGESFLEKDVYISSLRLEQERNEVSVDRTGVVVGELLAELAYEDVRDIKGLVNELLSVTDWTPVTELARQMQLFSNSIIKNKAKEILDYNRASNNDIRIGESIFLLGLAKNKQQIMDVLGTLKEYSDDAKKMYTYVSRDEFKSSWQNWLKQLQTEMSAR